MKKTDIIKVLNDSNFWNMDRFGHFKTVEGNYRVKIQATSLRVEVKGTDGIWINRASDYYKNISIATGKSGNPALIVKNRYFRLFK